MSRPHIISASDFDGYIASQPIASSSSAKRGSKRLTLDVNPLAMTVQYVLASGNEVTKTFGFNEFDQAIEAYNDL